MHLYGRLTKSKVRDKHSFSVCNCECSPPQLSVRSKQIQNDLYSDAADSMNRSCGNLLKSKWWNENTPARCNSKKKVYNGMRSVKQLINKCNPTAYYDCCAFLYILVLLVPLPMIVLVRIVVFSSYWSTNFSVHFHLIKSNEMVEFKFNDIPLHKTLCSIGYGSSSIGSIRFEHVEQVESERWRFAPEKVCPGVV